MPVNWEDESQIDKFRTTALDRGLSESDIDKYISLKSQPTAQPTSNPTIPDNTARQNLNSLQLGTDNVELVGQPLAKSQTISARPQTNSRKINQPFGNPNARLYGRDASGRPNINRGVDISARAGQSQFAPSKGKWVVASVQTGSYNSGWGNSVIIKNTETGETIRRSHLDKVMVLPGQEVTGRAIGTTGRTGKSTGYHQDVEYTDSNGRLSDYLKSPYYNQ